MEEQKGARVQSMITWDVTDVRNHTIQPIMLQGGKQIGIMTTVQLCTQLIGPILNLLISDKKTEITNMSLRRRTSEFKCEECQFRNSTNWQFEIHMTLYHGQGWMHVKRSHSGRNRKQNLQQNNNKEQKEDGMAMAPHLQIQPTSLLQAPLQ